MSIARWVACAIALAAGTAALGAEGVPAGKVLRWADVVAALDRDPRLASARARALSAEAAVAAAATPPNPEVEGELGRGAAREGPASRQEWSLAVSMPLDWLARRGPSLDAARATVDEQAAEARALRSEVAAELWRLHLAAGYGEAEVETLEATEEQLAALAKLVRRRVEAGEGRPVEVPRVELELERARNEVDLARARRDGALARLGSWLGVTVEQVELPAAPLPAVAPAAELGGHPRVRAALARAAGARAEASVARRSRFPALSVGGFYASELDREAVGGRVVVELPLWDWKSGEVRRAEATADAEARRADAEGRALAAALADASASCARARAIAERQRSSILPRAEESARTLERTFQLGEAGLLDVIDARRVLLEARRESLSSARERDMECGALILSSGRELP